MNFRPFQTITFLLGLFLGTALKGAAEPETLDQIAERGSGQVLEIFKGSKPSSVATVVSQDGYLLAKHSDFAAREYVGIEVRVDGRKIQPRMVSVLPSVDLVLLKIPAVELMHVVWNSELKAEMGDWLVSVSGTPDEASLGVVSAQTRKIQAKRAALGIQMQIPANDIDVDGVTIVRVIANSPAARCGIRENDVIKTIEEREVQTPDDVRALVALSKPGAAIEIVIERNGRQIAKEALLEDVTILNHNPADKSWMLNGRTSTRRVDFPEVIQHDTPLDPKMMGGALFDLEGSFLGINIARVNRFTTYALPVRTFASEVDELIKVDRARSQAVRASLLSPSGPLGSAKTQP